MAVNVVTYMADENGEPKGIMSGIVRFMCRSGIIEPVDNRAIVRNSDNKVMGAFYSVKGPKIVVDFLSWATNYPFKKRGSNLQNIETDPDGNITKSERIGDN